MIGADESTVNITGSKQWLHGAWTEPLSAYHLRHSTGRAAVDDFAVLPGYASTLVRDAPAVHDTYPASDALCGGHLICELTAVAESHPEQVWPIRACTALAQLADLAGHARPQRPDSDPQHGHRPGAEPVSTRCLGLPGRAPASPGTQADQGLQPARADTRTPRPDAAVYHRPGRALAKQRQRTRPGHSQDPEQDLRLLPLGHRSASLAADPRYISTVGKHHHDLYTALHDAITGNPWRPPGPKHHSRPEWLPICT